MKDSKQLSRIAGSLEALSAPAVRNTGVPDRKERMPLMASLILAIGASEGRTKRGQACRRSFPIIAYVGPNGGGKSLAMILDTIPTMAGIRWECRNPGHRHTAEGIYTGYRTMLSTVKLLDPRTGLAHPLYTPFTDFAQLIDAEHCDILMDEVNGVASSRESSRMDARVANVLVQLRRRDIVLRISAPNWARADKIIREVTQAVVECRGYFPARLAATTEGGSGALWAPKRVFRFRTFDTADFEEWTAGKRDKLTPVNSQWFRGAGSDAFKAYDTLDAVDMVAGMTPEDTCSTCEGRVSRPACKCNAKPRAAAAATSPVDFGDGPFPEHFNDDTQHEFESRVSGDL